MEDRAGILNYNRQSSTVAFTDPHNSRRKIRYRLFVFTSLKSNHACLFFYKKPVKIVALWYRLLVFPHSFSLRKKVIEFAIEIYDYGNVGPFILVTHFILGPRF